MLVVVVVDLMLVVLVELVAVVELVTFQCQIHRHGVNLSHLELDHKVVAVDAETSPHMVALVVVQ